MTELPGDLLYTDDHEWLRREDDGSVTVGITDHAQASLGDLVYVELPEEGQELDANGEMAVVESVKAASDVYAPIAGVIVAVNTDRHAPIFNVAHYGLVEDLFDLCEDLTEAIQDRRS